MQTSRRSFLLALGSAAVACRKQPPPKERLYVSCEVGGFIGVIDPELGAVLERIQVGKRPRGVRLSHDGKLLYVALSGSPRGGPGVDESTLPPADRAADGIGVVDLAAKKLQRSHPSGQDPECFDLSLDGKSIFISNEETAELSELDLSAAKVTRKVTVGGEPEGVTLHPSGKLVYVTSEADSQVHVVDVKTLAVTAHIKTGARPRSIAFSKDGNLVFITNELGSSLTVADGTTHAVTKTLDIPPVSEGAPSRPMGLALSPDGKTLFVSNGRGGSIALVDVASASLVRQIGDVGKRPWGIAVSADGKHVYTANGPSDDVSVVDVSAGKVVKRVAIGGAPWGLAVGLG
jgi:YVTN family beta-propeller protein